MDHYDEHPKVVSLLPHSSFSTVAALAKHAGPSQILGEVDCAEEFNKELCSKETVRVSIS